MIYVALLRGINVGGKNKIDMKALKITFENVGMESVTTYINSGNIIFEDSTHSEVEIIELLESVIQKDFSLKIKVLIRNIDEMETVIETLPTHWKNDKEMKSDVLFLWDEINHENILREMVLKPEVDTVIYISGAVLWHVPKSQLMKSGMTRLASNKLYKKMTIRNVNSTRKIYEIMKSTSEESQPVK